MMKRISVLAAGLLLLTACGKPNPQITLDKMHEAMMAKVSENLRMVEYPKRATVTTNITLKTLPLKNVFEGNADIDLSVKQEYDVSDIKNLLLQMGLTLKASVNAPAGMLGGMVTEKKGEKDFASADVEATLRSAQRKLTLNIGKIVVSVPSLPQPFTLPETFKNAWYGATFDEINAELKKSKQENAPDAPTIDEMLERIFSGKGFSKEAVEKLYADLRVWKGIELLPEQDGKVRVRVETDKEALKKDIDTIISYMGESAGPSWKQLQKGKDFEEKIRTSKEDIEQKFGVVRGVMEADKDTYAFRGFQGEVLSVSGTKLGDIAVSISPNGDALIDITDVSSPNNTKLTFKKTGSDFTFTVEGKQIVSGTVTDKLLDFTIIDPKTGLTFLKGNFPVKSVSREELSIEGASLEVPSIQLKLSIDTLHYVFSNNFKNMAWSLIVGGNYQSKPLFSLTVNADRKEQPSVTVELPAKYSPFMQLQQDLSAAFMGAVGGGAPVASPSEPLSE